MILGIDTSISQVADFLVEATTSIFGISVFVFFCAILVIISVVLFRYIKKTISEVSANYSPLRVAYLISLVTQFTLSLILIAIIIQIVSTQEYYSVFLIFTSGIAYGSAAAVSVISSIILVSWFKISRNSYVTLIFGAAFAFNVYVFVYVPLYDIQILAKKIESLHLLRKWSSLLTVSSLSQEVFKRIFMISIATYQRGYFLCS